ncbi:MAG TPA: NAD(P)H-dependent oxidoreductase [Galbitalea sp.]
MPTTPHIAIIVASTRTQRFADHPLTWVLAQTASRADLTFEVLDLRDHPLPFYDHAGSPAMAPRAYASEAERALGEKLDAADGYLVLTNEYNHGYSAALKNTLDHFFVEWNRKPISFVGYGSAGGARAIEQLRQVADELDMASVRPTVNILGQYVMAIRGGGDAIEVFAPLEPRLEALLADLHWWAIALGNARDADKETTDASDEAA